MPKRPFRRRKAKARPATSRRAATSRRKTRRSPFDSAVRPELVEGERPAPQPAAREGLPSEYGCDLILLQPRDPHWLHAYWELRPETLAQGRARLGQEAQGAELILRVYEVEGTDSSSAKILRWFDLRLTPFASDWYIEISPPDRAWMVEIGFKGPQGTFIPLARSNTVRTPPDQPSDLIDEEWGYLEGLPQGRWPGSSSMVRPPR